MRDNLWGILEGKRDQKREEEARKTALLESELRLKEAKAGLVSSTDLQLQDKRNELILYSVLAIIIIAVVIAVIYIKKKK